MRDGLRTLKFSVMGAMLGAALLLGSAPQALAQAQEEQAAGDEDLLTSENGAAVDEAQARALLGQPLPADATGRYALLQRQFEAARALNDRARQVDLAEQLATAGRGRPGGEEWIRSYLSLEFVWGSSGKALAACEAYVNDAGLSLGTRAAVALRQAYFAAQGPDVNIMSRYWSRADDLSRKVLAQGKGYGASLPIDRLQVRSEVETKTGNPAAGLATLRESIGVGRHWLQAETQRAKGNARDAGVLDATGWLDGSQGMLVYALVRQGRPQEAIDVAQANLALWRAKQLSDGLGARWHYRLAVGLVASQQYEAGLAAGQTSDEMLQRQGASPKSHTRWLARNEVVRALIGLKRWPEADAAYRDFLAQLSGDELARNRASDWRLVALLAAKNGRTDEALATVERSYRYRMRLYGAQHPQTQEAAGVRAVVRLMRGDIGAAMGDYEQLFAATLDSSAGWLDLESKGLRSYVLGIAFGEFMDYVAAQGLKGAALDPHVIDRALQVADRSKLGVTQRALTDSTARVLAATPQLSALLDQEQVQRQAVSALFSTVNVSLGQEDRLRKEMGEDAFKALPREQRKPKDDELKAVREQIKAQQAEAQTARTALAEKRDAIARQFPAYADLVTPSTPSATQLRTLLQPDEALVVIEPLPNATLIWLIGADGRRGFHASPLTADALATQVAGLRQMLDLGEAPPGKPPKLQAQRLYSLYRELLAPLEPQLRGIASLVVATGAPLSSLPIGTLVTKPPEGAAAPAWLVRQMAVTQIPAASALQALRRVKDPQVAAKALMGFGDPLFKRAGSTAPVAAGAALAKAATSYDAEWGFRYADVPPLPDTRAELIAVAAALGADPKADLVLGAAATRRAVLDAKLSDRRVVAFATHGLMPGELPGISKPALAMAANADERETPLLELDDVLTLRLNAQWVLLSACNTAAGEAGGAAMSGLVRGFFFAGARSVLATHWAVDSESAAALSSNTFKATAGRSRAESLRQAQLAMIEGTLGNGRWTHPYYWAPYALFGDPSR